ncbi:hypothetical protein AB0E10_39395 [Streptomyces sp. NPDC048045]|uniref:hypothetical protein n=1 Tax=Streptomyces sp. NPDC048045 TaxID=3154710 RepID=UPI003414A122
MLHTAAHLAVARSYVLAAEPADKQHSDEAWVASDRSLAAARCSRIPVAAGEASRQLAIAMRRSGRSAAAVSLLTKEAGDLDPSHHQTAAVRTTLLLTGAYSAATSKDRSTALSLMQEASQEADHRPAVPGLFTVEATQAQVNACKTSVLNALGTPDEGVGIAARLDIDHMQTATCRRQSGARAWADIARMGNALGCAPQTFAALQRVGQGAP